MHRTEKVSETRRLGAADRKTYDAFGQRAETFPTALKLDRGYDALIGIGGDEELVVRLAAGALKGDDFVDEMVVKGFAVLVIPLGKV